MGHPTENELVEYAAGALSSRRLRDIRRHLSACDECQAEVAALVVADQALDTLLDDLPLPAADPGETAHPVDEELAAVAEGTAPPALQERVLAHVGSCPECAAVFGAVHRETGAQQAPARSTTRLFGWYYTPVAAAAALVLAVGLFFFLGLPGSPFRPQAQFEAAMPLHEYDMAPADEALDLPEAAAAPSPPEDAKVPEAAPGVMSSPKRTVDTATPPPAPTPRERTRVPATPATPSQPVLATPRPPAREETELREPAPRRTAAARGPQGPTIEPRHDDAAARPTPPPGERAAMPAPAPAFNGVFEETAMPTVAALETLPPANPAVVPPAVLARNTGMAKSAMREDILMAPAAPKAAPAPALGGGAMRTQQRAPAGVEGFAIHPGEAVGVNTVDKPENMANDLQKRNALKQHVARSLHMER